MSAPAASEAEADLTPILDLVFQLITFFMLVFNFQGASMDLSLKLPVLGSARPLDTKGSEDLLILNINSKGELKLYGAVKDIKSYLAGEAKMSVLKAQTANPNFKTGDELPGLVVIRADRTTPFHLLNFVIKTCQDHGYRRFSLKAMSKEEGA
jgi:biopolymer transport protein ExbD